MTLLAELCNAALLAPGKNMAAQMRSEHSAPVACGFACGDKPKPNRACIMSVLASVKMRSPTVTGWRLIGVGWRAGCCFYTGKCTSTGA